MFRFRKSLLSLVGLLGLVIALAALTPLVIRGQGNSGNAPPTLDVNVVNTPSVVVANTPDATAEAAYVTLSGQWDENNSTAASNMYTVPAGKRLVIEHVSGWAELRPGQTQRSIILRVGSVDPMFQHYLPVNPPIAFTLNQAHATYSQPLRLYVDSEATLIAVSARNDTSGFGFFAMDVSGYLVDIP